MEKQVFNLSKINGMFPLPLRERFQLENLTFPSPTAFFGRRGSDCRRGTSRTSTGEVRVRGKNLAFTLAEVLITLGIIGVVAAITMPTLIQNHKEKQIITSVKKSYSILSQAYQQILFNEGNPYTWFDKTLSQAENSKILAEKFKPYLKIAKDCGADAGCFPDKVTTFLGGRENGNNNTNNLTYKIIMADGTPVSFYVNASYIDGTGNTIGSIRIDADGFRGNSVFGKDVFQFYFDEKRFYTNTDPDYINNNCLKQQGFEPGVACVTWILTYGNMDYLHCPEKLDWNGKTKCK